MKAMSLFRVMCACILVSLAAAISPAQADSTRFSSQELVDGGHKFFGQVSGGLANAIEYAVSKWGYPSAYILGEEASGAIAVGARYGEGRIVSKIGMSGKIFWQGPSLGFDFGGDGARTMILVYNAKTVSDLYTRFGGISGSAYFVGGVGLSGFVGGQNLVVVPIRSGVGVRLGVNASYIKFTNKPDWMPF